MASNPARKRKESRFSTSNIITRLLPYIHFFLKNQHLVEQINNVFFSTQRIRIKTEKEF